MSITASPVELDLFEHVSQQFALFASGERPPDPVELCQGAAHVANVGVLAARSLDLEADLGQTALAFVHFGVQGGKFVRSGRGVCQTVVGTRAR